MKETALNKIVLGERPSSLYPPATAAAEEAENYYDRDYNNDNANHGLRHIRWVITAVRLESIVAAAGHHEEPLN